MKRLFPLLFAIAFTSCTQGSSSPAETPPSAYEAKGSIEGTLKEAFTYDLNNAAVPVFNAQSQFKREHKDEILKTLEVVETAEIPKQDITLVFYRYSVGTDFARSTAYFKEVDGKWYFYSKYFSSYDDDPFRNGQGENGKALLEKVEKWEDSDSMPWWQ